MEVTIIPENGIQYIEISGRLDAVNSPELQDKLMKLITDGYNHLLINLQKIDYISSSGLRTFLAIAKKIGNNGSLKFCCIQPNVMEVFTISGFNTIFGIYETKEDALA